MTIENIFVNYIKLREKLDKGKIYKIVDNTNNNIYIGSTCKTLNKRLSQHKCNYKLFLKGVYNNVRSFDIIKNGDYQIELLENCDIKTKQELLTREKYYIENNVCLNKVIPGRTDKELRINNQDYHKQYYIANKDKIKKYYIANKDKIKDYYDVNKDKIIEYKKRWNDVNKDKINIKRNQKIDCECGGKYTIRNKSQHFKSQKHQEFIKSNN